MKRDNRLVALSLVVALAQISFLTWVIAGRAEILRDGQEIALRVHPVDPRDLLRGDYVRLGYDISSIPVSLIEILPTDLATTRAGPIYVRIKKAEDGYWHAVSASLYEPAAAAEDDGTMELRGQVAGGGSRGPAAALWVGYWQERLYIPVGGGRAVGFWGVVSARLTGSAGSGAVTGSASIMWATVWGGAAGSLATTRRASGMYILSCWPG